MKGEVGLSAFHAAVLQPLQTCRGSTGLASSCGFPSLICKRYKPLARKAKQSLAASCAAKGWSCGVFHGSGAQAGGAAECLRLQQWPAGCGAAAGLLCALLQHQLFLLTPSSSEKAKQHCRWCLWNLLPAAVCSCSSVFDFYQHCVWPLVFVQSYHHNALIHAGAETHSKEVAVHFDWQLLCYRKCVHLLQSVMEMDIW